MRSYFILLEPIYIFLHTHFIRGQKRIKWTFYSDKNTVTEGVKNNFTELNNASKAAGRS